jgi:glutamyl endopeptidase
MSEQEERVANPHTPVSNEPEDAGEIVVEEEVSQPPSEGEDSETVQEAYEGMEDVPGREQIEAMLAQPFPAPNTAGLRDIAEASFGPPPGRQNPVEAPSGPLTVAPEVVIGTDDRVRITPTTSYPWRAHASLLITAADGTTQYLGTGTFIGPHTLSTAGHVVFIYAPGTPQHGWVQSIVVMPGRDGSLLLPQPFGSFTSTIFRTVAGWANNPNRADAQFYDYGAIIAPFDAGNTLGTFGFGVWSDNELLATTANISGYPAEKQPSGTQWYHARQVASVSTRKVFYETDTTGGQSGSAVYRFYTPPGGNPGRYEIAIHAYGALTGNSGTRIVQPVYDNFVAWRA